MDIWVSSSMELLQTQLLEPLLSMSRGVHVEFLSNRVYVWLALVEAILQRDYTTFHSLQSCMRVLLLHIFASVHDDYFF